MRIGIDAKWYFFGPPGGHTYVHNILHSLAKLDEKNRYIFYVRPGDPTEDPALSTGNVRLTRLSPSFSLIRVKYALIKAARSDNLDLLFTQSLTPLTRRIPCVITIHDVLYKDFPQYFTLWERIYFHFINKSIRQANFIVTVSNYTSERIKYWFPADGSRVMVTPNSINERFRVLEPGEELAAVRRKYNLPSEFLLYVGRLNARKNLPRLFRALRQCSYDVPLVCVGKKDWKSEPLERIVENLQMNKRIIFTGFVPDEEIPLLMNLATAFVYVPYAEGFGIPPLEAMACGTPVVTSNTTSLPEVVGNAGLLVSPNSEEEITEALNKIMGDAELRAELRQRGLLRAKEFSWDKSARVLINVWEKFQRR